jgi:N-acetylmuramoyl-L-alanine amidase
MLKKTHLTLCFIFIALFCVSFTPEPKRRSITTIIIDAGHGGKDPGAKGLHTTEAAISLAISKKLGEQIEKELPGIKVLFTRTTDIIPGNKTNKTDGLRYRADFANNSGADLFLSIHCNSAGKAPGGWYERRVVSYTNKVYYTGKGSKRKKRVKKVPVYKSFYVTNEAKGTETFIWTAAENSHKEQMVDLQNEVSSEEDSTIVLPENDPVINALKLIYTKKYFARSLRFADLVQQEFERSGRINRGVKQRNEKGIWVLHATGMPSVLIEAGFISNKEEEKYMMSDAGQEEIVNDIVAALKNYVRLQENQQLPAQSEPLNSSNTGNASAFLQMIEEKERHGIVK